MSDDGEGEAERERERDRDRRRAERDAARLAFLRCCLELLCALATDRSDECDADSDSDGSG